MTQGALTASTEHAAGAAASARENTRAKEQFVTPAVDIFETPDGLTLVSDLPGVAKETLDIQVIDEILTLQARTRSEQRGRQVYREFQLVNFFRQFQLADTVDAARITADLKNGVLTLRLPRAEAAKPKKIPIQMS